MIQCILFNNTRFGDVPLDPSLMWKMMEGVKEPFLDSYLIPLILLLLVTMLPLSGNGYPALNDQGQLTSYPNLVAGMPDWAFAYIIIVGVLTLVVLYYISKIPNDLTGTAVSKEGQLNASVIILARHILNTRVEYDAPNEAAIRYRDQLVKAKGIRNIHVDEVDNLVENDALQEKVKVDDDLGVMTDEQPEEPQETDV